MNKTVVIGDIHGRDYWKQIVANENPDRVIFMGDYFDSFDHSAVEQMHNFKEIIEYKETSFTNDGTDDQHKTNVIMLIGNHDYHYINSSETYSGFQQGASPAINHLLYENKKHMQMAYGMNGFIFTHAGVSSDWLQIHGYDNESNLIDWVNDMWKYKPNVFGFAGRDPYGDSNISSPIWIRPHSLQKANRDTLRDQFIQVVGHTQQNKIDTEGKSTGGRYYYIDTLGTSGEYMVINDDKLIFPTYKNK